MARVLPPSVEGFAERFLRPTPSEWWTTVYLGVSCQPVGEPAPDRSFPDAVRQRPLGTYVVDVDAGMARRYAEVSGDWSPHHFDAEAARRSGPARPFLHGLCTIALCVQGVVDTVTGGDPDRVRRPRFASRSHADR